jgi:hypothetical protein
MAYSSSKVRGSEAVSLRSSAKVEEQNQCMFYMQRGEEGFAFILHPCVIRGDVVGEVGD